MNGDTKNLLLSKTFWGSLVAMVGGALALAHFSMSPEDAQQLTDLLYGVASAVGGLVAIYGRVVATKKIG